MLFNIYIHDLLDTTPTKYSYVDDLAIMLRHPTWKAMEDGLNRDMGILADYLQKWHLQLSVGKTVAAAYHLNHWEARRGLDVYVGKNCLEFQQASKYLGRKLCPCLEQKSTCEQGRYCHQQHPPDSNWLSETHPCILPANPCWNRVSQSQTGCSYHHPGKKSPEVWLAHPAQSHNNIGSNKQAQVSPSLQQGSTRDVTVYS
ncbi:hypothetical protein AOLI_G00119020 [Acnodon oligacanthus]